MRKVTKEEPYSMDEARRDVFAALLRVVARDMEAEIEAGERLVSEGKGTVDGLLPPEAVPLCLSATREILAEMRRRSIDPSPLETPRSPAPRDAADDYADPAPHSDSCVGRIHDSLGCSCRPDPAALAPRDGDPRFAAICRALRGDAPDIDEAYRIAQEATTGAAPASVERMRPMDPKSHRSTNPQDKE